MSIAQLHAMNGARCSCGKLHSFSSRILSGAGVLSQLPDALKALGIRRPYILFDQNTKAAAGDTVCQLLQQADIPYHSYCFGVAAPEPNEYFSGAALMHMDADCDGIIGVGSGVINDICKLLSSRCRLPFVIVATAPSMDGYASGTSSMTRDGLKISLNTRSADVILGDTDILCRAPMEMLRSGLGDMLAKYVSICEWRIAQLICGEYYCPEVAQLVRSSLAQCVDRAEDLLQRKPEAVEAVFNGLVCTGIAMNYAGLSRPASGVEHYISHIIDMRGAALGTKTQLHGTQCAVGTLIAVRLYEQLRTLQPNKETALAYAASFSPEQWNQRLRDLLGSAAEPIIALEEKEHKYDLAAHAARLEIILAHWDQLLTIMDEELPGADFLQNLLQQLQMPTTLGDMGMEDSLLPEILRASKDIRDKYVFSRLAWDLGVLEELI